LINFKCTKCNEPLEAPESMAGQAVQCPKCNLYEKVPNPKRTLYLSIIISAILAGVVGFTAGVLLCRYESACDCLVCQCPSDHPLHPLEMNKIQFLKYLADKGFHPENDGTIDWSKQLDMTLFDAGNTCYFRTTWRMSGAHFYIERIFISNTMAPHSPENARPVLAIWQRILPDIVPLFKQLQSQSHPYGPALEKRYKDTYYMYGCSQDNKYFLNYDPDAIFDLEYPGILKR